MTTNPSMVIDTQVHPGMSDHFIIISALKVRPLRSKTKPRTFYQFRRANFTALQEDLANTLAPENKTTESADAMWNNFKEKVINATDTHVPKRK